MLPTTGTTITRPPPVATIEDRSKGMAAAKKTMADDALRRRDDAIRSHLRTIRDLEGELIDRWEGYSAERDASQRDAVEYKRERDANARKASRLKEELEDMRREGKERDVEAGERDARICALESELADRREKIDMLEDARGRRARLQMEMNGMTSRLDDLADDVRMREEELALLRGDVGFARTEKEEGHVEYEELGIRLVRGREELLRITREASRLERETSEASHALEEARVERERMLAEARSSAARCEAEAAARTHLMLCGRSDLFRLDGQTMAMVHRRSRSSFLLQSICLLIFKI